MKPLEEPGLERRGRLAWAQGGGAGVSGARAGLRPSRRDSHSQTAPAYRSAQQLSGQQHRLPEEESPWKGAAAAHSGEAGGLTPARALPLPLL